MGKDELPQKELKIIEITRRSLTMHDLRIHDGIVIGIWHATVTMHTMFRNDSVRNRKKIINFWCI